MTPDQILATIAALLAGPTGGAFDQLKAGGEDPRYPVTIEACPRPLPVLDIEDQTLICGSVNVPENHDKPDGNRIDLAFAVLKARSQAPQPDALIYLHGGPGGRAVPDIAFNAGVFDRFRDRRDLVLFDQRASGISAATITCYDTLSNQIFADEEAGLAAETEEATAAKASDPATILSNCLDEVKAKGVVIGDYSTTQNAHDVRAIMSALGYPVYNAYGISYGTKLAQELIRAAPEGLRAVVIDSIAAVDIPSYDTNGDPLDQAIGAVVDQCSADAACASAYPDLEKTLNFVAERLKHQPIPATATRGEIGLEALIQLFENRNSYGNPPQVTAYIPKILTEFATGQSTTYDAVMGGATRAAPTPESLIIPYIDKVRPDQLAFALAAAQAATALDQQETLIGTLLRQLSAGRARPEDLSDLESLLDNELSAAVPDIEVPVLIAMSRDYARLLSGLQSAEAIDGWMAKYLPEAHLARARALLAVMSQADVDAFFDRASRDTGKFTAGAASTFDLAVYACQESIPFNSRAGFEAALARLRFPFLVDHTREGTQEFYDFCNAFKPVDHPGFHDPVKSSIPTLAMAGLNDTQTNGDAAKHMAAMLGNAQAVTFPESGHGVILFSPCAIDIAESFIEHPDQLVNTSCTEGLAPQFVLP
jgi:pimeloyl-ACP methyl ester carboxylesterase